MDFISDQAISYVYWDDVSAGTKTALSHSLGVTFIPTDAAVGDSLMFGMNNNFGYGKYHGLRLNVSQALVASGYTYVWEYATGSTPTWSELPMVLDYSDGLQVAGNSTVTWRIPEDWDNYNNPAQWYHWWVRLRITGLTSVTTSADHAVGSPEVMRFVIRCLSEGTITFDDIYDADKAGTVALAARGSLTTTDAAAVNNYQWLRPADKGALGGSDLQLLSGNWSGVTSVTIRLIGTDTTDTAQTEDVVLTPSSTVDTTKFFKTLEQTQVISVTGTGTFDYYLVQNQWGVISKMANSFYMFECTLYGDTGTTLTSTLEAVVFARNWFMDFVGAFQCGYLDADGVAYGGSLLMFENFRGDYNNVQLSGDGGAMYNTQIRVKGLSAGWGNHGFWGGYANGNHAAQDLFMQGFRSFQFGWNNVNKDITIWETHVESSYGLTIGMVAGGGAYGNRLNASMNGAYQYEDDYSAVNSYPLQPYLVNENFRMWCVDTKAWGDFALTSRAYWRNSGSTTDNEIYEAFSFLVNVNDPLGNPIEGAHAALVQADDTEQWAHYTNEDGYILEESYQSTTYARDDRISIAAVPWTENQWRSRLVYFTSGALAGQKNYCRRLQEDSKWNTTNYVNIWPGGTFATGDRFGFPPYIVYRTYVPSNYASGYFVSVVTTHGPFTLKVTKPGYKDLVVPLPGTSKVEMTLTMQPRRYPNR